jgi:hypothetical protein
LTSKNGGFKTNELFTNKAWDSTNVMSEMEILSPKIEILTSNRLDRRKETTNPSTRGGSKQM